MANDGATNTARNHQPARSDAHATLPNRNNASFKIPRNALKTNLESNPNRNKNSVTPSNTGRDPQIANQEVFTGREPRVKNHDSRRSRLACPDGHIALRRGRLCGTQATNHAAPSTNHQSFTLSALCEWLITNHSSHVTMLHPHSNRHTVPSTTRRPAKINRQPRRLEFTISPTKQTPALPNNRQQTATPQNALFARRTTTMQAAAAPHFQLSTFNPHAAHEPLFGAEKRAARVEGRVSGNHPICAYGSEQHPHPSDAEGWGIHLCISAPNSRLHSS